MGLRVALMADAAEGDVRVQHAHAVRVLWDEARGLAGHAVDVFDAAAAHAAEVVVVVIGACFIARAAVAERIDPADEAVLGEILNDVVSRLGCERWQLGDERRVQFCCGGVGLGVEVVERRDSAGRDAQSAFAQPLAPGRAVELRRGGHSFSLVLF